MNYNKFCRNKVHTIIFAYQSFSGSSKEVGPAFLSVKTETFTIENKQQQFAHASVRYKSKVRLGVQV